MKAIENIPLQDKYSLIIRQNRPKGDYALDYLYSEDLGEIETGIQETIRGIDTANLVVALAITRIEQQALYAQAGCKSYLEYLDKAVDRLNMSRQSISDYKRIGETYLEYKSKLQQIGFEEEGNLHKLRFLKRALEHHRQADVFKHLMSDSLRSFIDYAVGISERSDAETLIEYKPEIKITQKQVYIDGQGILRFATGLDERVRAEITEYLRKLYKVRSTGNMAYVIDVYDEKEAKAVEAFIRRRRARQ